MSVLNKMKVAVAAGVLVLSTTAVYAKDVNIRVQSVLGTKSDEVHMLKEFAKDVHELTGGSVTIEVLPGGSVVGNTDIIDAIDAGLLDGGFCLDPLLGW